MSKLRPVGPSNCFPVMLTSTPDASANVTTISFESIELPIYKLSDASFVIAIEVGPFNGKSELVA